MPRTAPSCVADTGRLTAGLAALADAAGGAQNVADMRTQPCHGLSGALERTLHALEPYLMQLRLRSESDHA